MFAPLFLYAYSCFKNGKKVCFVFLKMIVFGKENNPYLCASKNDSVAQLVEQLTLNQWVEGSSPSGVTSLSSTYRFSSVSAFSFGRAIVEQSCKNTLQQPYTKQTIERKLFSRCRLSCIFKSHKSTLVTFQKCNYLYHLLPNCYQPLPEINLLHIIFKTVRQSLQYQNTTNLTIK